MRRAIFLDRDGVINATLWNPAESAMDSPYRLEDFRLLPRVANAVRLVNELGFLAVVISNQPGGAKGKCSPAFLDAVDRRMVRALAGAGARLDSVYYCLHHPKARVAALRVDCECRKPKPGLLLRAGRDLDIDLRASYMAGDSERDVTAGIAAGRRAFLAGDGPLPPASPHLRARDLLDAVEQVAKESHEERAMVIRR